MYQPKVTNWQSCLEALMSGDFLTPVFAGLVFRDTLRFLGPLGWSDRATLIEQSWERHFRRSVKEQNPPSPRCLGNLDCPFVTLRPRDDDGRVEWLPLLLLNGASVSTGQRIVTSTIDPWYQSSGPCLRPEPEGCPLLDHAYDFHLLVGNRIGATGWLAWLRGLLSLGGQTSSGELNDIRLSTAAHNSARFPLVSPPGEVRNQVNNVIDRIVDGGYFENFGAQTALELANAMRAVDPKLVPFILIISNDPEIPTDDVLKAPDAGEGQFLTDLSAPAKTILNTRAARGTLAVDGVVTVLSEDLTLECAPYAAHIRVWPEFEDSQAKAKGEAPAEDTAASRKVRPLSFSWWLSKPVQWRLHQQTSVGSDNRDALMAVAKAFAPKPPGCGSKDQSVPVLQKYEGVRAPQRQRP